MDRTRIGQAAQGKRASELNKQFKRRVFVYLLAIVIVYGAWRIMRPKAGPLRQASESIDALDTPADPLPPAARVDTGLMGTVRDSSDAERAYLEQDALVHLLEQAGKLAYGDLEQLGMRDGDWDELAQDSSAQRGNVFSVLGQLKWMDTEQVGRLRYYRGQINDETGRPWTFAVLTQPWDIEVGDVVRLAGFYLKQHDMVKPNTEFVRAPLIVGEEILASSYLMDPVLEMPADLFESVQDHSLTLANRPLDSLAYYTLLSYVTHAPLDVMFPEHDPPTETMPHLLLQDPGYWRGRSVHMTGVLMYMKEAPLGPRGENPLGDPFVWQLWVSDTRSGDAGTMLVMCLDKPEGVAEGDIVDVKGTFFRRFSFENKANHPRMVAVIPSRSIERFVPGKDELTPVLMRVIVGVVAAIVLLVAVGQWRERRSALVARGSRMARRRRIVTKNSGSTTQGTDTSLEASAETVPDDADGSPEPPSAP